VAKVALAENLHADDALPAARISRMTLTTVVGIGVHIGAEGINANEMNLDPGDFVAARSASMLWQEQP